MEEKRAEMNRKNHDRNESKVEDCGFLECAAV
jgi:hypothetical protein